MNFNFNFYYLWLTAMQPKRETITSQLSCIFTEMIKTLRTKLHGLAALIPAIKFDCDPNYLDKQ